MFRFLLCGLFFFLTILLVNSCDKDDDTDFTIGCMDINAINYDPAATEACTDNCCQYDSSDGSFDRVGLLTNWVDNIIIPKYAEFQNDLAALESAINLFTANPDTYNLQVVSNDWLVAYRTWQHLQMFNIGLAEALEYQEKINIYPVDLDYLEQYINDQVNDVNVLEEAVQGFPAIDYMLHHASESDIVALYTSNPLYGDYLQVLIEDMISITQLIAQDWDFYREEFINSIDNTLTSSINMVINDFIYYYEKYFRDGKIAIPAGVRSGGVPQPQTVEAYYKANVSKELALEALFACENFFSGKYLINPGVTLESYLNYLPTSSSNNLSDDISVKFTEIEVGLNTLNDNFIYQIGLSNGHIPMVQVFATMQQQVALLKTDMLGALQIAVDYLDTDGD